jgi:hypothetical protein
MLRNLVNGFRIIRFDTFLMQVISLTTGKMEAGLARAMKTKDK